MSEAWSREQLARLRAEGFRPRAWARFLVASQREANAVRAARPVLARQEAAWAATGAGAWLALAAARVPPFAGAVRAGLGGWAVCVLMLDWHLGMVETEDGRPRPLGGADALTLARAWLVPAVAREPRPLLCALGLASDALDGPLARAAGPTRLGRDLEGLVDACFAGGVLVGTVRRGGLGRGPAALELARLAAGFGFACARYLGRAEPPRRAVLAAGRVATPLRGAALLLGAAGRRRAADRLLVAGSAASLGALVQ